VNRSGRSIPGVRSMNRPKTSWTVPCSSEKPPVDFDQFRQMLDLMMWEKIFLTSQSNHVPFRFTTAHTWDRLVQPFPPSTITMTSDEHPSNTNGHSTDTHGHLQDAQRQRSTVIFKARFSDGLAMHCVLLEGSTGVRPCPPSNPHPLKSQPHKKQHLKGFCF
jgi:hypothetical protein